MLRAWLVGYLIGIAATVVTAWLFLRAAYRWGGDR